MQVTINNHKQVQIEIDEQDQCGTCANIKQCPLIGLTGLEEIIFRNEIIMIHCGLYKKNKNNLLSQFKLILSRLAS
jgi:hypothetical protein